VLVNGLSPDGEYDGESYELPEEYVDYLKTTFLAKVANTYNESVMVSNALEYGLNSGIVTEEEVDELFEEMSYDMGSDIPSMDLRDKLSDMIEKIAQHRRRELNSDLESRAETLVSEIEEFLKNGGK
jgi:hypothetical protein